ncbi:MAG: aminopeptidase P family N-terminal domain-containing protein, partial [Firmicutes bacterium]|nr:aminopeptidase P family N-terminal domain-containing protein [Bacillota bacterium]
MNVYRERVGALRAKMAAGGIDYYLIFTNDFHGSEYVSDHFKCREFLSGFTGSAGTLLIGKDDARLWTDGRYFIQAESQLSDSGIELMRSGQPGVPSIENYLASVMLPQEVLGYDGRTISSGYAKKLRQVLSEKGVKFINDADLAGEIWEERSEIPSTPVWLLTDEQAGMSRADKLRWLRNQITSHLLITSLDDIAWLYNMRADDVLYTPVAMVYTLISAEEAILYLSEKALTAEVRGALEADGVTIRPYMSVYEDIKIRFGAPGPTPLQMDEDSVNEVLSSMASEPRFAANPTLLAKAIKNQAEIEGERNAHIKDGVAVTKAIYRLQKAAASGSHKELTELEVSDMLLGLRREQEGFISPSFESIVATGEHGAVIHYAPTAETSRSLADGFLLMDTGGHYTNGTTDITRTIALGEVSEYEKKCYTAVLKGNLAVGSARFPAGTTGNALDSMARRPLWDMGLDYNHGTGHGVGFILSV